MSRTDATAKTVLEFSSMEDATRANAILSEAPELEGIPIALFEERERWVIECYDNGAMAEADGTGLAPLLKSLKLSFGALPAVEAVPDADWVSLTRQGLPVVRAGPFLIHGSHVRERAASRFAIEIDAGRAFGTAHHASTRGCLIELARWSRRRRGPGHMSVLDLGTGSGLLAIASVKATAHQARALAIDSDPVAIAVARQNGLRNGAGANLTWQTADGSHPFAGAPRDLILANILARPLIALAPRIGASVRRGGEVILSGFAAHQAREVVACYLARSFSKIGAITLEGWTTVTLRRTC